MSLLFELLEALLFTLDEDTKEYSYFKLDHPCFKTLVNLTTLHPEQSIPWLLNKCSDNWYCLIILNQIVPENERPTISEEMAGQINRISAVWLAWGKTKGYL